ncbi:MAG: glycosyltransferase [Enterococcaceae bacterium]|nr:glycosyltransferase [Enterococcaceae bacterium]
MKVLLYFEGEKIVSKSGVGRALAHQKRALAAWNIDYSTDPRCTDYDILHINTYGPKSSYMIWRARRMGKKVIYHAHSTEEDFRNSFVGSNALAPLVKKRLVYLYRKADHLITPTPYAKKLLKNYGLTVPIAPISNGIDLKKYYPDPEKEREFRNYFQLAPDQKVVMSVGLFFKRKGIIDFIALARRFPAYTFIWFGDVPLFSIPRDIREIVKKDHPQNVIFPGYITGAVLQGAYSGADLFFFPSYEETEGIVVLEALASKQQVLLRDIPVYQGWMQAGTNCFMGRNNDQFAALISEILQKEAPDLTREGYQTAQARDIRQVGRELRAVYEHVLGQTPKDDLYQKIMN